MDGAQSQGVCDGVTYGRPTVVSTGGSRGVLTGPLPAIDPAVSPERPSWPCPSSSKRPCPGIEGTSGPSFGRPTGPSSGRSPSGPGRNTVGTPPVTRERTTNKRPSGLDLRHRGVGGTLRRRGRVLTDRHHYRRTVVLSTPVLPHRYPRLRLWTTPGHPGPVWVPEPVPSERSPPSGVRQFSFVVVR